MNGSLFDRSGNRKYLVTKERHAFVRAALDQQLPVSTFCLTLALTGARLSEVLALTPGRVDQPNDTIVFETLKQRRDGVFRSVPVPHSLGQRLADYGNQSEGLLWPWGRTHAWKVVKGVMFSAGIGVSLCQPKALRHAFAIEAGQSGVPLNMIQRWLGHARIDTTCIYLTAMGEEERRMARKTWCSLESLLS